MAPNVYAHVTLLQPHAQTQNDLPIRLYGIAPDQGREPATRLQPVLEVPEVLPPETTSTIRVREASGRPMTYTLAVVDEGLLGLTRFETPNPWNHFYAREALAVRTWDLYDDVLGRLRRGDGAHARDRRRRGGRLGQGPPRQPLPADGPLPRAVPPRRRSATGTHDVEIPQYVGRRARDGGRRPRRRLRRGGEVGLRAPAADAARDAAARARARGERGAAGVGVRARADGQGRGAPVTTQGPLEVVAEARQTLSVLGRSATR